MNLRFPLIVVLGCALAAGVGYFRGSRNAQPIDHTTSEAATTSPPKSTASQGSSNSSLTPQARQTLESDLVRRFLDSPGGMRDFRLLAEIAGKLGSLTTDDLRALAGDLQVGLRSELAIEQDTGLLKEIYRAWSRRDPAAAAIAFAENPYTEYCRSFAFHDWWRRDPEAVEAWLATAPSDAAHDACRVWRLSYQASADPEHLPTDLGRLGPEMRQKLISDWSLKFGSRRESWAALETLVAREGNPDFTFFCHQRMVFLVAKAPLENYLAMLERAPVREGARPELARTMCTNVIGALADGGLTAEDKAAAKEIYDVWHSGSPRDAEEWKSMLPGEARVAMGEE
ncbi:MAG TPA: hypothetical protein VGE67_04150 [Haloferula sp.]